MVLRALNLAAMLVTTASDPFSNQRDTTSRSRAPGRKPHQLRIYQFTPGLDGGSKGDRVTHRQHGVSIWAVDSTTDQSWV
ncbi:hypothetical protein EDD15DRAFT_2288209, partial [Pisolithus albus]